jgi:hypothetical protein
MALGSGLASQLGFKVPESAWGTYTAPDTFVPLVSESLTQEIDRLESAGIIAGARVLRSQQWSAGNVTVSGDVQLEVTDRSIGKLLRLMFGSIVTAGAGPYTHTASPGDLVDDFGTFQVGRPDIAGTVQPFSYTGMQVASWEIACAAGEIATMGLSLVGKAETTAQSLVSASYAASIKPMTFVGGALTIAAGSVNVKSMTLAGDNGLNVDRRFLGSQNISQPLESALRAYTGTVEAEFESLTAYNRFVNGTEAALVFTLASGAQTLVTTCNVRFDGTTPTVCGTDIIPLSLPFKAVGASTDAGAITSVFTTTESSP